MPVSKLKHVILIFSLFFLLYPLSFLFADTIIDSVYSIPELDGYLLFSPEGQPVYMSSGSFDMHAGDLGPGSIPPSPPSNSSKRAFISFELPEIPDGYGIDSVSMRLYQFDALGGYPTQNFPLCNVAGGDTIKCILNHIDYGNELSWDDWEKGDIGNPFTYTHNAGTVTESGEDGYRYLVVTDCILYDYQQERTLTQYRISFQIDTDWDDHPDFVAFTTSEYYDIGKPQLKLYLSNEVGLEDDLVNQSGINLLVYPNPISKQCRIMLDSKQSFSVNFNIYNIKGQLIQTVFTGNIEIGENEISFKTKDIPNGIYFVKATINQKNYVKKIIILK
jgi:hypothetical protein